MSIPELEEIGLIGSNPRSDSKGLPVVYWRCFQAFALAAASLLAFLLWYTFRPEFGNPWKDAVMVNLEIPKDGGFEETHLKDPVLMEELAAFVNGYAFGWYGPIPESPGASYVLNFRTGADRVVRMGISPDRTDPAWICWQSTGTYLDYDHARYHMISQEERTRLLKLLGQPRPQLF